MVYLENEIYYFYNYKATFKNTMTDKIIVTYTDDPDGIYSMVNKHSHMVDLEISRLQPTTEQYERLKEFNALMLEVKNNYINDCSMYAEFGAVLNRDPALKSIYDKSVENTKKHIISTLKPKFKEYRVNKEMSGLEHNGKIFDSDNNGRLALTSAMGLINISISSGIPVEDVMNQTIVWKMKDNTHAECTNKELQEVSLLIGKMVSDAFKTEGVMADRLNNMTLEELLSIKELDELRIYANNSEENEISLQDIFDNLFKEVSHG